MGPREAVYDEKIAPLMKQIIATCKEHGIPMLADFALDEGTCTTRNFVDGTPDRMRQAAIVLRPDWAPPMVLKAYDAGGNLTRVEVIV